MKKKLKWIKSEAKKTFQLIPQEYKGLEETTMNNTLRNLWPKRNREVPRNTILLRMNNEETENWRPVASKKIESGFKNFPTKKSPGSDSFPSEVYQKFQE